MTFPSRLNGNQAPPAAASYEDACWNYLARVFALASSVQAGNQKAIDMVRAAAGAMNEFACEATRRRVEQKD